MKKTLLIALLFMSFTITSYRAYALSYKMLFWYPGEAGSSADAEPILDDFFKYINKQIAPDVLEGKYFPTDDAGRAYIGSNRPAIGIISLTSYIKESARGTPMTIIAQTRPLPGGATTQKYYLVSGASHKDKGTLPQKIYSSEPLAASFVKNVLFSSIKIEPSMLSESQNTLGKLKSIADGEDIAAILTDIEYQTLKRMKAPWTSQVVLISESSPVPSAPVVAFGKGEGDPFISKIKDVLIKMGGNTETKPILESLRLAGFAPANVSAYQSLISKCK